MLYSTRVISGQLGVISLSCSEGFLEKSFLVWPIKGAEESEDFLIIFEGYFVYIRVVSTDISLSVYYFSNCRLFSHSILESVNRPFVYRFVWCRELITTIQWRLLYVSKPAF